MDYTFDLTSSELICYNNIVNSINNREKKIDNVTNKVFYRVICHFFNKINLYVTLEDDELHYSSEFETIDLTDIVNKFPDAQIIGISKNKLYLDKKPRISQQSNYKLLMDPYDENYVIIKKV